MRASTLWLVASVAGNILLTGLWLRHRAAAHVVPERAALTQESWGRPIAGDAAPVDATPLPFRRGSTSWLDLATEDLKELVRRLRGVQCPEGTIRDLVLAEVNRRYQARTAALWPMYYQPAPFWQTRRIDPSESKRNLERLRQEQALRKEKSALLLDLLGVDPEQERRKEEGLDEPMDWMEQRVAFLPESKRAPALEFLERFEEKMQEFYFRNQGMWDALSRAEQRELEAAKLRGLAEVLSPGDLREYELRQSQLASQLSHDLRSASVTRAEYEAIFEIRKRYGDAIYNYGDIESKQGLQKVEATKAAMNAELATALGPARFKEYARSQDYSYQELDRLVRRAELPSDTPAKVYDSKELAEQAAKQLQDNTTLTAEQRQTALRQIQDETQMAVRTVLGEAAFKRYLTRGGGWWLNRIAPGQ